MTSETTQFFATSIVIILASILFHKMSVKYNTNPILVPDTVPSTPSAAPSSSSLSKQPQGPGEKTKAPSDKPKVPSPDQPSTVSGSIYVASKNVPYEGTGAVTQEQISALFLSKPFVDWQTNFSPDLILNKITVVSVYMFGKRAGLSKFVCDVTNSSGQALPGVVFMRGGAVAILPVIENTETGKVYTILTIQARIPVGSSAFAEIPAGMLDENCDFAGVAAKELEEETGIKIHGNEMINLCSELPQGRVYPSAGGCDEFIVLYAFKTRMSNARIVELEGKLTGEPNSKEKIYLKVIPLDHILRHTNDFKAITAYYLFQQYSNGNSKRTQ